MPHLSLRITPEFIDKESKFRIEPFFQLLLAYLNVKDDDDLEYAYCYEKFNKHGEPTHPHYHLNICSALIEHKKDSIQAYLRKHHGFKGNACYALQLHSALEDERRWWRYVFKENPLKHKILDFDADRETMLAQDERQQRAKENREQRDKNDMKNQFRDQMFAKLKKDFEGQSPTDKEVFCAIIRYYQKAGKTPPIQKMMDVVIDWKLTVGIFTPEEYFNMKYN